jgi:hypothetical protein
MSSYLSPTVRLFGWPPRIEGVDKTLEFIQLTIRSCRDIRYEAVELACCPAGIPLSRAFQFDWNAGHAAARSIYVVLYRYRNGLIRQQNSTTTRAARSRSCRQTASDTRGAAWVGCPGVQIEGLRRTMKVMACVTSNADTQKAGIQLGRPHVCVGAEDGGQREARASREFLRR